MASSSSPQKPALFTQKIHSFHKYLESNTTYQKLSRRDTVVNKRQKLLLNDASIILIETKRERERERNNKRKDIVR